MSRSSWWYGIALFPFVLLSNVLSGFSSRTFIAASSGTGDPNVGVAIASFALSVVAFWGGIFLGLLVLGCVLADVRALRADGTWSPSPAWGLAGVANLVGVVFPVALVVSIPALSYYLYRRHERLGVP
jgi:hypothetical protein